MVLSSSSSNGASEIDTANANEPEIMDQTQPEPRALDTSLLGKIADGNKDENLTAWKDLAELLETIHIPDAGACTGVTIYHELDELVAEAKVKCQQTIKDAEEGGLVENAAPLAEHIGRVALLANIKESTLKSSSKTDEPTDAALFDRWIRQQLKRRWKAKYEAQAGERAVLKAMKRHAEVAKDKEKLGRIKVEMRALNSRLFNEGVQEEIAGFLAKSQGAMDTCAEEVTKMSRLYDDQMKILLENEGLSNKVIHYVLEQHENASKELAPKLEKMEKELDDLDDKLQDADRASRKLITRMNRLFANDVDDHALRGEEMNQRLSHPHAHLYVLKALEDIDHIPRGVKAALEVIKSLEEEIKSIQLIAIDAYSGLRSLA